MLNFSSFWLKYGYCVRFVGLEVLEIGVCSPVLLMLAVVV